MSTAASISLIRRDWLWLGLIWALAVASFVGRSLMADAAGPLFLDTDDAMRMVTAQDLLAGQNWYDSVQHRLNTPFGAEIHWSRLVDLPLAALLWLGQVFAGAGPARLFAGMVWPLVLLALLLFLSLRATFELVGREGLLPALVLPILSPAVLAEFAPGRVDHHNVIMLLTLACLCASLAALRRPRIAWVAGLIAATALAIAIEAAPLVAAAILAFGLFYVADAGYGGHLRRFGLSFGLGMVIHLILARPPSRWLEAACDMISPVYVLAGLAVGAAYLLVSLLPAPRTGLRRFVLLALFGLAATGVVILVYPQCLAGPYGSLDPWLQQNWIAAIVEAKPWHVSLVELPAYSIVVGAPVFLGLGAAIIAFWRRPGQRLAWLTLIIFLGCATLVMLVQIRGARLAILFSIPAAAWLIVAARRAYLARPRLGPALGLVASWLIFSGVILSLLVGFTLNLLPQERAQAVSAARASKLPCLAPESFIDLGALPPERIMAPIDLGSHLLLETPHEVVAAPYHRNEAGVLDAFRFFNRPVGDARTIATGRGLGLLVICEAMPEMRGPGLREDNTILSLLAAGTPPDWLADVSLDGPLKVYAVRP